MTVGRRWRGRSSSPARADALSVSLRGSNGPPVRATEAGGGFRRRVLRFEEAVGGRIVVTLERPPGASEALRIEEVGLFASDARLLRDERPFLRSLPDRRVYYGLLGRACLGLALVGAGRRLRCCRRASRGRWRRPSRWC